MDVHPALTGCTATPQLDEWASEPIYVSGSDLVGHRVVSQAAENATLREPAHQGLTGGDSAAIRCSHDASPVPANGPVFRVVQPLYYGGDEVTPQTAIGNAPAAGAPTSLAARSWLVVTGNFLFRWRDVMFPIVFVVLWLLAPPRPAGGSIARDTWVDFAGFTLALLGQTVRNTAVGYVYILRGGKNRRIYAEKLVQDGVFAHVRNPLYLGNFLIFLGLYVMIHSPPGYGLGVPFFAFAYVAIVAAEEAFLGRQFGRAYTNYCLHVPRFIPVWRGLHHTLAGSRCHWRRLVKKEYGSAFTWLVLALGIVVREHVAWSGWRGVLPLMPWWIAGFALLVAAYSTARFFKKSRRNAISR
jgi:protein-S-isoprenylcysteine O-methyltransferase Ste14